MVTQSYARRIIRRTTLKIKHDTTMAVMTLKSTQQDTMKARLSDILMHVSWGDISREYFGKSGSWLYHKLNGIDGNKKPTEFTLEERYQLKGALIDLVFVRSLWFNGKSFLSEEIDKRLMESPFVYPFE